ncbi:DUF2787 domain-containing protein, partial [Vibrio anguillarum]|nr:DUF2787 domain-containing protein [Vibrio anguillarum]
QENGQWSFSYITDFSYVGYPQGEIANVFYTNNGSI